MQCTFASMPGAMIVKRFDTSQGIYAFVEEGIQAEEHQHPALEVLLVKSGNVEVSVNGHLYHDVQGCLIAPNTVHAVSGANALCEIWIIEKGLSSLFALHSAFASMPEQPVIFLRQVEIPSFDDRLLEQIATRKAVSGQLDERILSCVERIRSSIPDQTITREILSAHVHLSSTRLSHLFKAQMGTTLQNYIIWERLKYAISATFEQDVNLLNAAYQAGFYDAAHFSRAFQKMFGLNPSAGYNSSILQI